MFKRRTCLCISRRARVHNARDYVPRALAKCIHILWMGGVLRVSAQQQQPPPTNDTQLSAIFDVRSSQHYKCIDCGTHCAIFRTKHTLKTHDMCWNAQNYFGRKTCDAWCAVCTARKSAKNARLCDVNIIYIYMIFGALMISWLVVYIQYISRYMFR